MKPLDHLRQAAETLRGIGRDTDSAVAPALAALLDELASDHPSEMTVTLDALTVAQLVNAGEWP